MRKSLLLLLAALLLPLAMGAQSLKMDLQPNQKILGHYTTDDLNTTGWGKAFFRDVTPIGTILTADELALFQGSKIVAFRVGLAQSAPVTRVFVIPVDANGNKQDAVEWSCDVSDVGWNLIELATPYEINLPADYSLMIGFDFKQPTTSSKPISAVNVGTIYPSYVYIYNAWANYSLHSVGNLSVQCICENDNFPEYVIRMQSLTCKTKIKMGDDLNFSFQTCNLGAHAVNAGECTYEIAIDGTVVGTMTNPKALTNEYMIVNGTVNTAGLGVGAHTLTLTAVSVNGEAIAYPPAVSIGFSLFEFGFTRQMRLVEQFTSTYCTYCPRGSAVLSLLSDMRGDVAWVAVHQNMGNTDVFRTIQCDTIADYQGCTGYPEGSFDRTLGSDPEDPNSMCPSLGYTSTSYGAELFNNFLESSVFEDPSWASVHINSTYDAETRKAVITVEGELVPGYEGIMGADSRLTVYITEDNLVAPQYNNGTWDNNYVHNNVLREALGSAMGVALNKTDNGYKNEFVVDIPNAWVADNLNIVAFISRPLGNALNDIYVTNTNMRKFGESDEPEVLLGDVNCDGKVTIDDVTALINYLLTATAPENLDNVDCYADGRITIDDVTALIGYLLSGKW